MEDLLGEFEYEVQVPYLLYRNAAQEVNGIWFYNQRECDETAKLFNRSVRRADAERGPPSCCWQWHCLLGEMLPHSWFGVAAWGGPAGSSMHSLSSLSRPSMLALPGTNALTLPACLWSGTWQQLGWLLTPLGLLQGGVSRTRGRAYCSHG